MAVRSVSFVVSTIAILFLASPSLGVGLTRTSTGTSTSASGWIMTADWDTDNDNGVYSCNSHAVAYDPNDPNIPLARSTAAVGALATGVGAPPVARVNGATYTDSYMGGGYHDGAGNWHAGAIQSFTASSETDNTVTSAGVLNHQISFSLQTGANTQEGYFYGWVRVGNVQVYFTWNGGDEVQVQEYIDGSLDNSFEIIDYDGDFTYDEPFTQTVAVDDIVEVDAYSFFVDDNNPLAATRTVTLQGGTQ